MKELAVQLSRLVTAIVKKSYNHCLHHALGDLTLRDI